jgi:hypothetical protein
MQRVDVGGVGDVVQRSAGLAVLLPRMQRCQTPAESQMHGGLLESLMVTPRQRSGRSGRLS